MTTNHATRIVDLSRTIENNKKGEYSFLKNKIKHKKHKSSRWLIRLVGKLPFRLFPPHFDGWADDIIHKMGVHSSTHLDAPWHYGPVCEGKPAKTIDQIPLEWCYGNGVVIDMSHKADFEPITVDDLEFFICQNNITIESGNIVLIRTDRDKLYEGKDYVFKGTGMTVEATEWLVKKGVKVMGIDQWGWDMPIPYMVKKVKENNNPNFFWEAHRLGSKKEYLHIEQLTNLDALPYTGFKVAVFPLKIKGASAGPARVVAIFE